MELRFRGKTNTEDTVGFWYVFTCKCIVKHTIVCNVLVYDIWWSYYRLCEGLKKRYVFGKKILSLTSTVAEWELLDVLEDKELHFLNESTGLVIPQDEAIAKSISDRDVVRLCSTVELEALQEKFATRDQEVTNEMMNSKATTPIGAAL